MNINKSFLLLSMCASIALAQTEIGILAAGSMSTCNSDNICKQTIVGDKLYRGDTAKTGKQRAQVRFSDGTLVTLATNTKVRLDEFANEPENKKFKVSLQSGTMRTITGQIGKLAPDKFKLETKTATIGVRGTDFDTSVEENSNDIYVAVRSGIVSVLGKVVSIGDNNITAGKALVFKNGQKSIQDASKVIKLMSSGIKPVNNAEPIDAKTSNEFNHKIELLSQQNTQQPVVISNPAPPPTKWVYLPQYQGVNLASVTGNTMTNMTVSDIASLPASMRFVEVDASGNAIAGRYVYMNTTTNTMYGAYNDSYSDASEQKGAFIGTLNNSAGLTIAGGAGTDNVGIDKYNLGTGATTAANNSFLNDSTAGVLGAKFCIGSQCYIKDTSYSPITITDSHITGANPTDGTGIFFTINDAVFAQTANETAHFQSNPTLATDFKSYGQLVGILNTMGSVDNVKFFIDLDGNIAAINNSGATRTMSTIGNTDNGFLVPINMNQVDLGSGTPVTVVALGNTLLAGDFANTAATSGKSYARLSASSTDDIHTFSQNAFGDITISNGANINLSSAAQNKVVINEHNWIREITGNIDASGLTATGYAYTLQDSITSTSATPTASYDAQETYVMWGQWQAATTSNSASGFFVTGKETSADIIDGFKRGNQVATYNGNVIGSAVVAGVNERILLDSTNTVNMTISFGSATPISGTIAFKSSADGSTINTWNATLSNGSITSNTFTTSSISGNVNGNSLTSGNIDGKFYGPLANAIGGSFSLNSASASANGVFKAKR